VLFQDKCNTFRTALLRDPPTIEQREDISQKPPIIWKPLTCTEVKNAIISSNPNKAPGPDGLSFLCIQEHTKQFHTYDGYQLLLLSKNLTYQTIRIQKHTVIPQDEFRL
jgi:hypothetical protein